MCLISLMLPFSLSISISSSSTSVAITSQSTPEKGLRTVSYFFYKINIYLIKKHFPFFSNFLFLLLYFLPIHFYLIFSTGDFSRSDYGQTWLIFEIGFFFPFWPVKFSVQIDQFDHSQDGCNMEMITCLMTIFSLFRCNTLKQANLFESSSCALFCQHLHMRCIRIFRPIIWLHIKTLPCNIELCELICM